MSMMGTCRLLTWLRYPDRYTTVNAAGSAGVGLGVVVDVVPTHFGVEINELRGRNQPIHQRLQPVLDPDGVKRAIREAVPNGLFDRTPRPRRPASKLSNAVVP